MLLEIRYWRIIQQNNDEKYKYLFSHHFIKHDYKKHLKNDGNK